MKPLFRILAILCVFFIIPSCDDDDDPAPTPTPIITTFTAALTPVAGTGSMAYGDATLKLNQTSKTFEITVNFTGLVPNAGHIHRADGGVEIPFPNTSVTTSPFTVSGTITDAQITGLMTGSYYVNLHTIAHSSGEISGTLIKGGTSGGGGGGGGGY